MCPSRNISFINITIFSHSAGRIYDSFTLCFFYLIYILEIISYQFTHLKCTLQWLLVIQSCVHHHKFRIFSLSSKETPTLLKHQSPSPPILYPTPRSKPLATTNLLSVCIDLPLLDISYKWNHIICGLLCLVSST